MRALASIVLLAVMASCSAGLRGACEQKCYPLKANEPRDFDDCIKRCRR